MQVNECEMIGELGGKYQKMHEQSRRVYSTNGAAPTTNTCCGGGHETKILVVDEQNQAVRADGIVGTLTTDGSSPKHNNRIAEKEQKGYRVRKLTEKECFRLMGVKDKDFAKIRANQSMSKAYHLAGDSIVTSCLMAIFGEMLDLDYETKIKELVEELTNGGTDFETRKRE